MVNQEIGADILFRGLKLLPAGHDSILAMVPTMAECDTENAAGACVEYSSPCRSGLGAPSRQINVCNGHVEGPSGDATSLCLPLVPFPGSPNSLGSLGRYHTGKEMSHPASGHPGSSHQAARQWHVIALPVGIVLACDCAA